MGATLPAAIQRELTAHYGVDAAPDVDDFIEASDDDGARESLLVREDDGGLEIALRLAVRRGLEAGVRLGLDLAAQLVEGVSHFLCLAERARRELPITQLELELQAEVDKYLLFAHAGPFARGFHVERAARVRERLFGAPAFLDAKGTVPGERYRLANDLAARFALRIEQAAARDGRLDGMRAALRRFYGAGQAEKIQLAQAA